MNTGSVLGAVFPPPSGSVTIILHIILMAPNTQTHRHLPEFPHPPERRQNEGERKRGSEIQWNALKWLICAASPLAVSPRRVTIAERE